TPAQLQMLADGLYGDTKPARRDLGLAPRPFTAESVRAIEGAIGPLFGTSLRLADRRGHADWLARYRPSFIPALALALVGLLVHGTVALAVANVWNRMAVGGLVLAAFALAGVRLDWRALYRPAWRHVAQGGAAAVALYVAGRGAAHFMLAWPAVAAQIREVYGWKPVVPGALTVPLLFGIVLGEEIVWRNAVTLPLAARLGPWRGAVAGAALFSIAHLPLDVPLLLLAAVGAGTFWSALVLKTRSAVPALVSHFLWDCAVLFWFPYVRS
ncbi:MAG TPA: CPBP family intramembrane glutamic endopeptidase, partial [Vicinamibacteria bacterium]|nr:CPBP family intramembrane glutamic endopeptidase [Vicinamibacteria bacterium]